MAPRRVLVTGAGGRTGEIALRKMAGMPEQLEAFGAARTEASASLVEKNTGAPCKTCSLTDPQHLDAAMEGVQTLVVLSSATPKPNWLKLLGFFCRKFCCRDKTATIGEAFEFPAMPEKVDWEGVRGLVDAAKRSVVKHVVLVGSMGGTKPDHFLNKMGGGNMLLWKRKAELYLRASGIPYTIIHPGGLLPHRGNKVVPGGQRKLVVGVDDELLERKSRCIPREDVADVVVQCVLDPDTAAGRAFDLVADEPEEGKGWDRDLKALLTGLGGQNCDYTRPEHSILQG